MHHAFISPLGPGLHQITGTKINIRRGSAVHQLAIPLPRARFRASAASGSSSHAIPGHSLHNHRQHHVESVAHQDQPMASVGAMRIGGNKEMLGGFTVVLAALASILWGKKRGDESGKKSMTGNEVEIVKAMESSTGGLAVEGNGKPRKGMLQRLRDFVPPPNERKKLLPLGLMFFVILFNYTILRDTKDVLVVTAAGAEIIPFLKTYCNLPGAIAFTVLYSKLSNMMSREALFYTCIIPFVIFFLIFGFVMYPNLAALTPFGLVNYLSVRLPASFAAPLAILKNWTFALFYTLAELWGSVVVSLLFWGFANEVTTVEEAKKYYPLFGLGANVALVFSGQYVRFVSDIRSKLPVGVDGWAISLKYLMGMISVGGSLIVGTYYWMQRNIMNDPALVDPAKRKASKVKTKLTLKESAKYLASSKYIRNLATLVIAYGMSINIVEVTWKSKLRAAYPNPNEYSAFMGNFSSCTGLATLVMMLVGRWIFRKFGWGAAASITPIVLGITGIGFFSLTLFSSSVSPFIAALGTTPLIAAVMVGAAQNVLSKSSKYSLFDPAKEMAYIPLDQESRSKGKAAIDVIGNPLGKSGGSFIQQILIVSLGSLAASTPYLAVILFFIIGMWLVAARSLDKQFSAYMIKEIETHRSHDGVATKAVETESTTSPSSA
eukprot:Plantae.Rhodophyta-Hildenbrandia_rubra.ctg5792.p1 GENE.Plantae.Rhodophyta-Hildenbrandia_rubra.ctg5792~~Plantae.Rhodophyta-Hildenbrandia_rubra.ctg5792.p1  ORF type:complete len:663 (+),score=109.05 Plantae.Rhodophyta-Hildenbrandia_rubra.ctg5792:295-2283(+)